MTDLRLYFFIMFNFLTSPPSFLPLFIYGSKKGQREKNRQKSEVFSTYTTYFDNHTLQNKTKYIFYVKDTD